jgi:uncharacterized secreted protein with C-terminal beta-propeller domain
MKDNILRRPTTLKEDDNSPYVMQENLVVKGSITSMGKHNRRLALSSNVQQALFGRKKSQAHPSSINPVELQN